MYIHYEQLYVVLVYALSGCTVWERITVESQLTKYQKSNSSMCKLE